jgi:hypothetical protein
MTLRGLQAQFQAYLLRPEQRAIVERVTSNAKVSAETRLGIYAEAYRLRLIEALDTDFPVLHALLGDDEFDRMARAYIDAHPSRHFSIRWFGKRLSEFLRAAAPYNEHSALAEMATFEWTMTLAFDAANDPLIALGDMAALPPASWPGMRLTAHASLHRLDLRWNVPAVWKAHTAGDDVNAPVENPLPVAWIVWRQDLTTYFRSLSVDEAWALDTLIAGQTFADICQGLCEWIDAQHVATHAAGLLKSWISDGMIAKTDTR